MGSFSNSFSVSGMPLRGRFVRNPMYLAVLTIILGQALLIGSWGLVLYAGIVLAAVVAFVKGYEEPILTSTYGAQYLDYRRNVPEWWPRLRSEV